MKSDLLNPRILSFPYNSTDQPEKNNDKNGQPGIGKLDIKLVLGDFCFVEQTNLKFSRSYIDKSGIIAKVIDAVKQEILVAEGFSGVFVVTQWKRVTIAVGSLHLVFNDVTVRNKNHSCRNTGFLKPEFFVVFYGVAYPVFKNGSKGSFA
jgi:hypothetical protein